MTHRNFVCNKCLLRIVKSLHLTFEKNKLANDGIIKTDFVIIYYDKYMISVWVLSKRSLKTALKIVTNSF